MADPGDLAKRLVRGLVRRASDALRGEPAAATGPVHVRFEGRGEGSVPPGSTLLQAASHLGIDLNHYGGGTCSCGTCRVEITDGARYLSRPEPRERMVLGAVNTEKGDRLGCQARVQGPVVVRIPSYF